MTERELKKLSRSDLLEMLLAQCRENEQLRAELDAANAKLESRTIALDNAGSIAEASLQLNGVFDAAQAACAQYIENIQILSQRQEQICAQMEAETKAKCDEMVRSAKAEADAYWMEVSRKMEEFTSFYTGLRKLFEFKPGAEED